MKGIKKNPLFSRRDRVRPELVDQPDAPGPARESASRLNVTTAEIARRTLQHLSDRQDLEAARLDIRDDREIRSVMTTQIFEGEDLGEHLFDHPFCVLPAYFFDRVKHEMSRVSD